MLALSNSTPVSGGPDLLTAAMLLGAIVMWSLPIFVILGAIVYLLYLLLSLPLRRQERARFFLDLLETGFKQGKTPESLIMDVSASREPSLGFRFHLLAAYIQSGHRLSDALVRVPRLLPPALTSMIRVGEAIGDLRKVLPACRVLLRDNASLVRSANSYSVLISFIALPFVPIIAWFLRVLVTPKFKEIFAGILGNGAAIPTIFNWNVFDWMDTVTHLSVLPMLITLLLVVFAFAYLGGPQFFRWLEAGVFPLSEWVVYRLPWCRLRMQRNFSAMLGLLLDSAVPESKAVQLAADGTGNRCFVLRSKRVLKDLENGCKLETALQRLDDSGEFQWRMQTAARAQAGFTAALAGWLDALDSKAYQQEQTVAQLVTTAAIVFNGLIVGTIVVGMFKVLVSIVNVALLW